MKKSYCKRIDEELLVEKYVEGKMSAKERHEFEHHLSECQVHAQAVTLEKALHRGISEFARSEIRTRLKRAIQKREDIRFYTLRYAAILFLVVITPLLLYYQFYVPRWDENQYNQMPPSSESAKLKGEKDEELKFEEQSYEKEERDADLSPVVKSNQLSEKIVAPLDLKKKIDTNMSQPARASQKQKNVAEDIHKSERHNVEERIQAKSSPQSLQKVATEKKSAGHGISVLPSEMQLITTSGKADSETYRSLEHQMKLCIEPFKTSLKINPYLLTYSFVIDTMGHASQINFPKMSESVAGIDSCIRITIQGWQFKKADKEISVTREIILPFE